LSRLAQPSELFFEFCHAISERLHCITLGLFRKSSRYTLLPNQFLVFFPVEFS